MAAARERRLSEALEEARASRASAEAEAAARRVNDEMSQGQASKDVAALKRRLLQLQRENVQLKRQARK